MSQLSLSLPCCQATDSAELEEQSALLYKPTREQLEQGGWDFHKAITDLSTR